MRWKSRAPRSPGHGGSAELDARLSESWDAAAAAIGKMLDVPAGLEALLASPGLLPEETTDLRAGGASRVAGRRRRRLVQGSAAAATAALTAAAVALAVAGVPGAGHGRAAGPAVSTAYIVQHVDTALSAADPGVIAQLTVTTRGGAAAGRLTVTSTAQEWSYGDRWRSVTYSRAGHLAYDEGFGASSGFTVVSFAAGEWARERQLGPRARLAPGPRGCAPVVAALPLLFQPGQPYIAPASSALPANVAGDLRAAVSCGSLAAAGRQRVDGVETIELTSRPDSMIPETIWVSPGTYLPVRLVVRLVPGTSGPSQTADISWLRPTAQNLARLTVPVPAGFRLVPLTRLVAHHMERVPG
jgi:hypothetical protein